MGDGRTDDPLGILTPKQKAPVDDDPLGIKKKVTLQERFGIPLPVFKNGGTNGSSVGQSDGKQKVLDYMQGLKTPEEKELAQPNAANTKQLAYNQGQQKLQEIISTGGHNDPLAVAQKNIAESDNMQDKIKNYMAARFVEDKVDGADAKQILETSDFGKQGADNLTSTTLRNKVAKYEAAVTPLRNIPVDYDLSKVSNEQLDNNVTPDLQRAAVQYGARKDPEFAKELQKLGIDLNDSGIDLKNKIGTFKMGQWMEAMMNDPDVNSYLKKENPNLIPAFQRASKQLRVDNKDYGINQVASEVSREVNKTGFNNIEPIANYYGDEHKKFADQIANQLYKDDPQSLEIWNKYIKDNQEAHMDAPSLLEGVASAGKEFGQGIVNTFTEPGKSISQDVKDKWQKEAENISADPEGMLKFLRDSGHALGTVMSIGATAGLGGGLGLSSEAANMAAIGVGFFGDQLKEKKLMYDNPVKAYTSALLNTGLYMLMGKRIFPADKVKQAFGEISPKVDNLVENLASGKITREAAKEEIQGLGKKVIDLAGGTLSKNAKITAELMAIDKLGNLADEVMGGNPKSENDIEKAGTTFLSNLAVAGLAKYGEMKTGNRVIENSLDKAASEPLQSGRAIDILTESQDTKDQMKSNLGFLTETKKKLVEDGVDPKQHGRFLFEALREKVATDNLEAPKKSPLGTSTRKLNEQINNAQDIQEKILNGEDVVGAEEKKSFTEPETKAIDAIKNKYLSGTALDIYGKIISDENTAPDQKKMALREISDQLLATGTAEKVGTILGKDASLAIEELGHEAPKETTDLQDIYKDENKVDENIPLKKANEDVAKLETERDAEIEKASKPDLKMEFVSAKELVDSKDPIRNKQIHSDIKDRFKKLREVIDCLWRKK